MICLPCSGAADAMTRANNANPDLDITGHLPTICRDHGRAGCPCQHSAPRPEDYR